MQPADFAPRGMTALQVLDQIKNTGSHIVLVVDEYGGIEGLLTHHDILEAIAGDMPLGTVPTEPKAIQRKDGSWLLDGMLSVDDFKDLFHIETLPGEKKDFPRNRIDNQRSARIDKLRAEKISQQLAQGSLIDIETALLVRNHRGNEQSIVFPVSHG